jgi:hypothetical protein
MKEASGTISGPGAFGKLKFESGIHRVQVQWWDRIIMSIIFTYLDLVLFDITRHGSECQWPKNLDGCTLVLYQLLFFLKLMRLELDIAFWLAFFPLNFCSSVQSPAWLTVNKITFFWKCRLMSNCGMRTWELIPTDQVALEVSLLIQLTAQLG